MVLSFLVFVTFIAFVYSVLEPATRSNEDKINLVNYIKIELLNEFSADMSILTIKISADPLGNCVSINTPDEELEDYGTVVQNISADIFESYNALGKTELDIPQAGVFKIYYSEEFDSKVDLGTCTSLTEDTDYEISLLKTNEEIFGSRILNIIDSINTNKSFYEELKQKFDVGLGNEFGFYFNDENKNFIAGTQEVNVSRDIFVEEVPIQYIDSEANIKSGFLNIKVW